MITATLSPKFQIAIPKKIREILGLDSGVKFEIIPYDDRIELIPVKPARALKGLLKGMDTTIEREKDRL